MYDFVLCPNSLLQVAVPVHLHQRPVVELQLTQIQTHVLVNRVILHQTSQPIDNIFLIWLKVLGSIIWPI